MKKRTRPCVVRWHHVSRMKNEEEYCLKMLQLFSPWRNENDLKHQDATYTSKFNEVESEIRDNIDEHMPFEEIDVDQLANPSDIDSSDNESGDESDSDNEYIGLRPDNLEFSEEPMTNATFTTHATVTVATRYNTDQFYEICAQLNEKQKVLFNAVSKHIQKIKLQSDEPDPFFIFLSGGGGVGKSFLIQAISEYALRYLTWRGVNHVQQPSIVRTASTGVAASNIFGQTLHSAFSIPVLNGNIIRDLKEGDTTLNNLRTKYQDYTKIIIIDEISMVGLIEWNTLEHTLKLIKGVHDQPFGGVSILACGDLFQLPPIGDPVYPINTIKYRLESLVKNVWEKKI